MRRVQIEPAALQARSRYWQVDSALAALFDSAISLTSGNDKGDAQCSRAVQAVKLFPGLLWFLPACGHSVCLQTGTRVEMVISLSPYIYIYIYIYIFPSPLSPSLAVQAVTLYGPTNMSEVISRVNSIMRCAAPPAPGIEPASIPKR